jgi:hypothetical protein
MDFTVSKLLILVSLLCFVLAVFNVDIDSRNLVAAGLAFFAAAHLVP